MLRNGPLFCDALRCASRHLIRLALEIQSLKSIERQCSVTTFNIVSSYVEALVYYCHFFNKRRRVLRRCFHHFQPFRAKHSFQLLSWQSISRSFLSVSCYRCSLSMKPNLISMIFYCECIESSHVKVSLKQSLYSRRRFVSVF